MTKIIQRHDTAANWSAINPVLALGEMGVETDTNKFKFGDGTTPYNELPYAAGEGGGSDAYTKEETDNLLSTKQDILSDGNGTKALDNKVNINQGTGGIQGLNLYQNNGTITKNSDLSITFNNGACGYIFLENKGVNNDYEIVLHQSYLNTHGTASDSSINGVRCLPQAVVPTPGQGAKGECWFDTFSSPFRVVAIPNGGVVQQRTVDNINYIKYIIKGTNLTISYSSTGEAYTELYTISISSTYVINVCIANSPWQNDIANKWTKTTLYSDSYVLDKTTGTYLMKQGIIDEGVAVATSTKYGLVLPDNSTIVSNNGIISAIQQDLSTYATKEQLSTAVDILNSTKNNNIFDISKFKVINNPTITDDGVASGFKTHDFITALSNNKISHTGHIVEYCYKNLNIASKTGFPYFCTIRCTTTTNSYINLALGLRNSTGDLVVVGSGSGGDVTYIIRPFATFYENPFDFEISFNSTTLSLSIYQNGELKSSQSATLLATPLDSYIQFGNQQYNNAGERYNPWTDTIDLKNFSVTVDGKEVFSGLMSSTKPIYDKIATTNTTLSTFKADTTNNFSAVNSALDEKANLSDLANYVPLATYNALLARVEALENK